MLFLNGVKIIQNSLHSVCLAKSHVIDGVVLLGAQVLRGTCLERCQDIGRGEPKVLLYQLLRSCTTTAVTVQTRALPSLTDGAELHPSSVTHGGT